MLCDLLTWYLSCNRILNKVLKSCSYWNFAMRQKSIQSTKKKKKKHEDQHLSPGLWTLWPQNYNQGMSGSPDTWGVSHWWVGSNHLECISPNSSSESIHQAHLGVRMNNRGTEWFVFNFMASWISHFSSLSKFSRRHHNYKKPKPQTKTL